MLYSGGGDLSYGRTDHSSTATYEVLISSFQVLILPLVASISMATVS